MRVWLDAQLSPALAQWMCSRFGIEASHIRDHGLRDATDEEIFEAARAAQAVVMSKDRDFVHLVQSRGAPPQVLWVTCGNTSNQRMEEVLEAAFEDSARLIAEGEPLVEITDRSQP